MATIGTETYGEWLSRKLDESGYTVRAFAKKMNPEAPEIARRSLRRYLKGMVPIERTRQEIAAHLDSDETGPPAPDSDDDAEDDLLAALESQLAVAISTLAAIKARNDNAPATPSESAAEASTIGG